MINEASDDIAFQARFFAALNLCADCGSARLTW